MVGDFRGSAEHMLLAGGGGGGEEEEGRGWKGGGDTMCKNQSGSILWYRHPVNV